MIFHAPNTEFGSLSEDVKSWFKLVIRNIIEYCEGVNNYNIVHVDKGGETIYGVSTNASPTHAEFYQWLKQMYSAGVTYRDDRVLTPLAVFYFNEYASTRPLLKSAIRSKDYSIVWLLLNFYIWGFKKAEVIKLTQQIVNKSIDLLQNYVKLGDYLTCRGVFYKLLFSDQRINRAFKFRLMYELLSNITYNDVYLASNKYGAIANGMRTRFYKNFVPLLFETIGDDGLNKIVAGQRSVLNNAEKFKVITNSMED